MNRDQVLRVVFKNDESRRYTPRATNPGVSHEWKVWDRKCGRFLDDNELVAIDPSETWLSS